MRRVDCADVEVEVDGRKGGAGEKEKSKRVAALCIRPDLGERSTE